MGIGNAFQGAGWATKGVVGKGIMGTGLNGYGNAAKVFAHSVAGGLLSEAQGGKLKHGFAAAGVAQAFSGAVDLIDAGNTGFSPARVVAAALLGGTTSVVSRGKFANGAITAAFARAFNDEHGGEGKRESDDCSIPAGGSLIAFCTVTGGGKRYEYKGEVVKRCEYRCAITFKDSKTIITDVGTFAYDQEISITLPGLPNVNACGVASTEVGSNSLGCFGQVRGRVTQPGTSLMIPGKIMSRFQVQPIHGELYEILSSYHELRKMDIMPRLPT
ncbi:hypothetical protein [Microbulbifer sp. THAF38]|uniref:hypothetical protein n=1 Tax=Microbulbifer sp. THAF38 TaxID=2587856 RepID=UPI001267C9EC|nr:hypothetical protein [Microbulbifer sp. THAF38]QFT55207.1 hypothetical protein FIU95_11625 [Microbulbifer sp. THAF38]